MIRKRNKFRGGSEKQSAQYTKYNTQIHNYTSLSKLSQTYTQIMTKLTNCQRNMITLSMNHQNLTLLYRKINLQSSEYVIKERVVLGNLLPQTTTFHTANQRHSTAQLFHRVQIS